MQINGSRSYGLSMDRRCAYYPHKLCPSNISGFKSSNTSCKLISFSSVTNHCPTPYKSLVSEAVRLLGPPARFDASKLKVIMMEENAGIIPRAYTLSHCDFTANLTLLVSNIITFEQLKGWYKKDDVIAEWKKLEGQLGLHVHCFVSGPNTLLHAAAEFRYHIFSKEMPLVLEAVLHGDAALFSQHPELMNSIVWVFFHSNLAKYNRLECWGPLEEAIKAKSNTIVRNGKGSNFLDPKNSIFRSIFTIL